MSQWASRLDNEKFREAPADAFLGLDNASA
jgi:hypothetical protein